MLTRRVRGCHRRHRRHVPLIFLSSATPQVLTPEQFGSLKRVYGDIADGKFVTETVLSVEPTSIIHLAGLQIPTCKVCALARLSTPRSRRAGSIPRMAGPRSSRSSLLATRCAPAPPCTVPWCVPGRHALPSCDVKLLARGVMSQSRVCESRKLSNSGALNLCVWLGVSGRGGSSTAAKEAHRSPLSPPPTPLSL